MKIGSSERIITEVVVEIRQHTVPASGMETLDLDKLEPDEHTVTSRCRKLYLDRKVRVRVESDPDS